MTSTARMMPPPLLRLCAASLLLLLLLLHHASADTSVHILSTKYGNGQLVTSSILNWIPESHYSASKNFVVGGWESVDSEADEPAERQSKRVIFVCRALHNGIWVAGGQKEGDRRCTVTLTGSVRSYERYQLLENVESAARLNWTDWTKYYQPPRGAVATGKLFVARHVAMEDEGGRTPRQSHYIGTLNSQDSLGTITYVKEDGQEGAADNGQLLVETEPISYDLNAVKLNLFKRRVVKRVPRLLGQATLRNDASQPANVAEAFGYSYQYSVYWGQGHAMLKGLNTTVTMQNKTRLPDIKWGIEVKDNRTAVHSVEVYLEPGTAVNVTLRADQADIEVPYTGKLHPHYEDGAHHATRLISGVRREESLVDVTPELGPVYFLGNLSLVPTTEPPPTTEPVVTTTTTTTSVRTTMRLTTAPTTEQQQQQTDRFGDFDGSATEEEPFNPELDENSILSKRPEGMQGDDTGPLSLKDKAEENAATALRPLGLLLLVATLLLIDRLHVT